MTKNTPAFYVPKPFKIYPKWYFWFEKKHLATLELIGRPFIALK
jgi:hypothetical protein